MYKIVYTSPSKLMADDADKAVNKKDEKGDAEKEVLDLIEKVFRRQNQSPFRPKKICWVKHSKPTEL
jgi:hypothetical protein